MKIQLNALLLALGLAAMTGISEAGAQDLGNAWGSLRDRIQNKDWVKISGGMNATAQFNAFSGAQRRFDPFTWRLNANLNLDILGIQTPFSAAFSDGNTLYNLPRYAFYGISPAYKWATLHLGDRSMAFSPYTLSGHNFFGTGLELKPGKFHFSAMYGRLRRARPEDINSIQNFEPAYRRVGWGFKAGYDDGRSSVALIVFKAGDDPGSLPAQPAPRVHPEENVVIGLSGKQRFGKVVSLGVDVARSALSRNTNSPDATGGQTGFLRSMAGLIKPRTSTGFHHAFKTTLGFATRFGQLNLSHERIDPGYRTLGTLFFNNDLENITAGGNAVLMNKKLTLSANAGIQRNGLSAATTNAANRFIGSLNLSAAVSERWNMNLSFSNFNTTTRLRAVTLPFVTVDSIILAQSNLNASLNAVYVAGANRNSVFTGMLAYQQANAIENEVVRADQSTTYYLGMLAHTYTMQEQKLSITSSVLGNYGIIPNFKLLTLGPSISLTKSFLQEKVNLTANANYSAVFTNGESSNRILTLQANANYRLFKKHRLGLRISFIDSESPAVGASPALSQAFNEFNGGITYGMNF